MGGGSPYPFFERGTPRGCPGPSVGRGCARTEGKLDYAPRKVWGKMLQVFACDRNEDINIPRGSCPPSKLRGQTVGGLDPADR